MTLKEFVDTNWHRGNVVKLQNGKEYLVKGTKGHGRWLLLYSEEYDSRFIADYRIVDCRTSDYKEPEEVYLEKKRKHQEEAAAKREAERQEYLRAKAERKQKNIEEQERIHREAVARKAAIKREKSQARLSSSECEQARPEVKAASKALRQKEQDAKKETSKKVKVDITSAQKVETKAQPKVVEEPKAVKAEVSESAPEAPKKRVRQRIRITAATPIREKVEFFKKK